MKKQELTVNGEALPEAAVRAHAALLRSQREAGGVQLGFEQRVALQNEARQLLVDRKLLLQEAQRLSFACTNAEIEKATANDGVTGCRAGADTGEIVDSLLISKLLSHWGAVVRRPGLSELHDHYRTRMQNFYQPEMIHASHVVRQVHADAAALRERVIKGEDFASVAAEHSDCPENNGDLGWFARGVMVEEFDHAVFAATTGELTPVFQTEFGFHFALVHARREARVRPFEEVRKHIEQMLWLAKQDKKAGLKLEALQQSAIIGRTP